MSSEASVTHWLGLLKAGDPAAAAPLWQRYFGLLVGRARAALGAAPRRAADEEDVALSAFDSFCRGAAAGRFPLLLDRDTLWPLLVVLTSRKAHDLVRDQQRHKRGGGRVRGESALAGPGDGDAAGGLDQLLGSRPTPAFAAEVAEECRRLLALLNDPGLEQVALWKMEGHSNDEIAARLGCVPRTVERKLRAIRELWGEEDLP